MSANQIEGLVRPEALWFGPETEWDSAERAQIWQVFDGEVDL